MMQVNPVHEIDIAEGKARSMLEEAREKRTNIIKNAAKAAESESIRRMKDAEQKAAAIILEAENRDVTLPEEDAAFEQIRKQAHQRQSSCVETILQTIPDLLQ